MKKVNIFLLLAALITLNVAVIGQTQQGKILLKGSTSLDFSYMNNTIKSDLGNSNFSKTTNFNINPEVGYFFIDNLAVTLQVDLGLAGEKLNNGDKASSTQILAGPFAYYYLGQSSVKPYIGAGIMLGSQTNSSTPNGGVESKTTYGLFGYGVGVGVACFLNQTVGLDLSVAYKSTSSKQSEDNPDNEKFISSGIVFSVGFDIAL